jgi:hypothetical protein
VVNLEHKQGDPMLKTLPNTQVEQLAWFRKFIPNRVAELKHNAEQTELIVDRKENEVEIEWIGEKDWPVVIGYPYIRAIKEKGTVNGQEVVLKHYRVRLDIGIPLIELFWSEEHQGFICVRKDSYEPLTKIED